MTNKLQCGYNIALLMVGLALRGSKQEADEPFYPHFRFLPLKLQFANKTIPWPGKTNYILVAIYSQSKQQAENNSSF